MPALPASKSKSEGSLPGFAADLPIIVVEREVCRGALSSPVI